MKAFIGILLSYSLAGVVTASEVSTTYKISDDHSRATTVVKGSMKAQSIVGKSLLEHVKKAILKSPFVHSIVVAKGEPEISDPSSWSRAVTTNLSSQLFVTVRIGNRNVGMQFEAKEKYISCGEASEENDMDDTDIQTCIAAQNSELIIQGPTKIFGTFAVLPTIRADELMLNSQRIRFYARKPYSKDENLSLDTYFHMDDRFYLKKLESFLQGFRMASILRDQSGSRHAEPMFLLAAARFVREINESLVESL